MRSVTVFKFALQSVTAGLALAFVVLLLKPEWIADISRTTGEIRGQRDDVITYSRAVLIATPAVVNVHTAKAINSLPSPLSSDPFFKRYFADPLPATPTQIARSRGSGVIMSAEGFVVTNHHLIRGADEIRVMLQDGREASATVFGADPDTDLAVLKIELPDLPAIAINEARQPRVGDVVLAIGNPFGVGKTVTMGIVSATGRSRIGLNTFEDFIQTDAAINPGNSGGALINPYGELIGINTAVYSDSGGSQGIGFAIPAALAHRVMQEIVDHGYVIRGWLGIEVQAFARTEAGAPASVTVVNVLAKTPAERADLRAGDILTQVDDTPVADPQSALNAIARVKPGNRVSLGILRNGEARQVVVTVAQRPPEG
ncbi:MAG: PDZ domain-containing protein [Proteobacteria bacterium]|nr:PDZ domain-containing protein [Pseudomonadota bacterium]